MRRIDLAVESDRLKELVRSIRESGDPSAGPCDGEYDGMPATLHLGNLRVGLQSFSVTGSERIRIVETDPPSPSEEATVPERERAALSAEAVCSCGTSFIRSKFNPYMDKCPDCRRKPKGPPAKAREFTCKNPSCGAKFTVSKFQPYIEDPELCQRCRRNARVRKYQKGRRDRQKGSAT